MTERTSLILATDYSYTRLYNVANARFPCGGLEEACTKAGVILTDIQEDRTDAVEALAEYLQVDPFTEEYKQTDAYKEWAKIFYGKQRQEEALEELARLGQEWDAAPDMVNSPAHYLIMEGVEVDDIQKALAKKYPDMDPYVAHRWMAAIEYLIRAPGKNWDEDFAKTAKLMTMILDYLKENEESSDE